VDLSSLVASLQTRIDNGEFLNGPKNKACKDKLIASNGMPEKCPHHAIFVLGEKTTCSVQKSHIIEANLMYICLVHMIQRQSGASMSTPLLEIMKGNVDVRDVYRDEQTKSAVQILFEADVAERERRAKVAAEAAHDLHDHDHDHDVPVETKFDHGITQGDLDGLFDDDDLQEANEEAEAFGHVPYIADPKRPGYCACDWKIKNPLARELHDARHANWMKQNAHKVATQRAGDAIPNMIEEMPRGAMLEALEASDTSDDDPMISEAEIHVQPAAKKIGKPTGAKTSKVAAKIVKTPVKKASKSAANQKERESRLESQRAVNAETKGREIREAALAEHGKKTDAKVTDIASRRKAPKPTPKPPKGTAA
jgi:hypothetical protein